MELREKVIKGLECCMSGQPEGLGCDRVPCPYCDFEDCEGMLHRDALALLKAQEPVEPQEKREGDYRNLYCGACGRGYVGYIEHFTVRHLKVNDYCCKCGKKVKWDDTD